MKRADEAPPFPFTLAHEDCRRADSGERHATVHLLLIVFSVAENAVSALSS